MYELHTPSKEKKEKEDEEEKKGTERRRHRRYQTKDSNKDKPWANKISHQVYKQYYGYKSKQSPGSNDHKFQQTKTHTHTFL